MPELARVRYTHDAIIDEIIAFPSISQGELARKFGFTQSWMSIMINSDSFQYRLAERKTELVDPKIRASVEARLEQLAKGALDRLLERLDSNQPFSNSDLIAAAKLGSGDRAMVRGVAPQTVNNYVVHLPPPASDKTSWLASSSRGDIIDVSHTNPGV